MIVGIDLGTTYSAVAYIKKDGKPDIIPNRDGKRLTPSAVMIEEDGSVVVGDIAKNSAILDGCLVIEHIKNEMGNPKYVVRGENNIALSPEDISSFILKRLKEDAERYLGVSIIKAVITVPAYFTDAQRKSTKDAGEIAGLEVTKIINEPTAAALAYIYEKSGREGSLLVYDLGGGTFDATIVHYGRGMVEVLATNGIRRLGGHFFDMEIVNLLAEYMEKKHGISLYDDEHNDVLQELTSKAEECKMQLTSRQTSQIIINVGGVKEKVSVTRDQFNEMIKRYYERTETIVLSVMSDAGLSWNDIEGVLMVGGSSKIPYIQERIRALSGKNPSFQINPDEAVAIGAALQTLFLENDDIANPPEIKAIVDVCSHGIGMITIDSRTLNRINTVIINKNSRLPAIEQRKFYTADEDQEVIKFQITEGEDDDIDFVSILGSFEIDIPRGLKRGTGVGIEMIVDENQLVHIRTRIDGVDGFHRENHISRDANLNNNQIQKKKELVSRTNVI